MRSNRSACICARASRLPTALAALSLGASTVDVRVNQRGRSASPNRRYISFSGMLRLLRRRSPSSSMVSSARNTSRSLRGSPDAGINNPRITARTNTSGLRPHHFPSPVNVWL